MSVLSNAPDGAMISRGASASASSSPRISPKYFLGILFAPELWIFISLIVQMALHAPFWGTILIHLGTAIGFFAARVAGGFSAAGGMVAWWFTMGTTGIALLVKSFLLENWASRVHLPTEVSMPYLVGYLSLLCAAFIYRQVPVFVLPRRVFNASGWTALAIFIFTVCSLIPFVVGDRIGGLWGALKLYTRLAPLGLIAAIAASVIKHPRRKLWHPFPLALLSVSLVFAVIGIGKEAFVSAGLSYSLAMLMFRRFSPVQFACFLAGGFFILITIVGPYSDTVRYMNVRQMQGWKRVTAAFDAMGNMFDHRVRAQAQAKVRWEQDRERSTRFTDANVGYLERFMTIAAGKELIQAAVRKGSAGWKWIIDDLLAQVPRFLNPEKSVFGSNYYYQRYSGVIPTDWIGYIGISFGTFAVLFAGGGLTAVAVMCSVGFTVIFMMTKSIETQFPGPVARCMVFMAVWHSIVEAGSPIDSVYVVLFIYLTLFGFSLFVGKRQA